MIADSGLVDGLRPSPNFGERRGHSRPEMLIMHYTGMADGESALRWMCMERSQVSSHYLIQEDGGVVQLVCEADRAWHAGAGDWRGRDDINSRSIGIEIVNPGHEHGYRAYPPAQVASVLALGLDIVGRHAIPPENVLGHSDVAPGRKQDPGELFPWADLAAAGLGHFVRPERLSGGRFFGRGDSGEPVAAFQSMLAAYGYGIDPTGDFDERTRAVTIAFQQHFRPCKVDGIADMSTITTLYRLLGALASSPLAAQGGSRGAIRTA
ncbi:N-acetylmuramoyl-L-alanine amidase [Aureimonas sp. SA4125]|uniref:N-acetylmuramoyl-L-alanine amidase n=1 Tax=Aureimonas sp. SA4125 TaxID=2826993 RepID=UPI001CC75F19|nr:N-acetylmuramoyl-L-alanine amidase [Aureimonas sp. SA4125]BDA85596.1 N-acetylmuramoyl-L-alanine amidase [Aureimonas sp. SA4125]